jgi:hypothetical protein
MESTWTFDDINRRMHSILGTPDASVAACNDVIVNQTTILPTLSQPIPAIDLFIINAILENSGFGKTFEEILSESEQTRLTYNSLKEDYAHAKEVITMLTRYRFCSHSEKKRNTGKILAELLKKIDDQGWIPPEFEGVDPQIVEKIRKGEIIIESDGTGKILLIENQNASSDKDNSKITVIIPEEGKAQNANGSSGSEDASHAKTDDGNSGKKPEENQPVEHDNSTQESKDEQPEANDNSGKKSEDGQQKAKDTSGKEKGKHARRTKGSLERKFENVEHVKCYTRFDDAVGMRDNPPLDADGFPMKYMGEKYVRKILVRIPARYILYECYSQTFQSMSQAEREEYAKTNGEQYAATSQVTSDEIKEEIKETEAASQATEVFDDDFEFVDEELTSEGIFDDELNAELDEELNDPEAMKEYFYSEEDSSSQEYDACPLSSAQNNLGAQEDDVENNSNNSLDKEEIDGIIEGANGQKLKRTVDTDKVAGMKNNKEEVYQSSSGPPESAARHDSNMTVESQLKKDIRSSAEYSVSGNHSNLQEPGDGSPPDSYGDGSG